ncbi:MAG: FAD-dependent monooxygenase [Streptosporangiaceae bacterium]|jgi:2-polyprenyl-6-methoxyphenol hydroxylase-like FAD-dependent oxidoreductase
MCVGGGPAGLYFALAMKLLDPSHDITVCERRVATADMGWGVTIGPDMLGQLGNIDPVTAQRIEATAFRWTGGQVTRIRGAEMLRPGVSGYGISRRRLLAILVDRAQSLGVRVEFGREIASRSELPDADLILASDGVGSRLRAQGQFGTRIRQGSNLYIWLGTTKIFERFTYAFAPTEAGWLWAYAYGADSRRSTFVVECSRDTWMRLGLDSIPPIACLTRLENIFAEHLDGHQLIGQADHTHSWLSFRTVRNEKWSDGNVVLAGDSAHTTHFSIGMGTTLALGDAIALAENIHRHSSLETALESYQAERQAAMNLLSDAASLSARWFENIPRYAGFAPQQFNVLLHARRSPLLHVMPPRLFYALHQSAEAAAPLRGIRKMAGTATKSVHSLRKVSPAAIEHTDSPR